MLYKGYPEWSPRWESNPRPTPYQGVAQNERDFVQANDSNVLGVLVVTHPRLSVAHIVVIDELGVVDPSDGFPEHLAFVKWKALRLAQGFVLESEFLAVSTIGESGTA